MQGQLGDCWFISALAVMGTQEVLLGSCFWRLDSFKEFGIFVCRSVYREAGTWREGVCIVLSCMGGWSVTACVCVCVVISAMTQ